jgi:hypothetical protein
VTECLHAIVLITRELLMNLRNPGKTLALVYEILRNVCFGCVRHSLFSAVTTGKGCCQFAKFTSLGTTMATSMK